MRDVVVGRSKITRWLGFFVGLIVVMVCAICFLLDAVLRHLDVALSFFKALFSTV